MQAGVYEVLGTSTACEIRRERVYRALGGGYLWRLTSNGQRVRSFETKREALVYCQEHPEL